MVERHFRDIVRGLLRQQQRQKAIRFAVALGPVSDFTQPQERQPAFLPFGIFLKQLLVSRRRFLESLEVIQTLSPLKKRVLAAGAVRKTADEFGVFDRGHIVNLSHKKTIGKIDLPALGRLLFRSRAERGQGRQKRNASQ